ncbi:MAG: hypothetical protein IJK93_01165 [Muribaculaceae bacterium]|nr:hypothetical protein [Muribaculaceae bacterium]
MNAFDNFLKKYLKLVDSGKFFRNVVKPAYKAIGWLHLLLPLLMLVFFYNVFADEYNYDDMHRVFGAHNGIIAVVLLLIFATTCLVAYLAIKFWNDRAKRLDVLLNNQSEFCVLPIIVTFTRNKGEGQGMVFAVLGIGVTIAMGLGLLCLSFVEQDYFADIIKVALLTLILGPIAAIVGGYLIVLIHRFVSESIGLMVSVAANVSKIANKN